MSSEKSPIGIWLKLVPLLMVVSLVAWCTSNNSKMRETAPVRMELLNLFQENGLVDSASGQANLPDIAQKIGESGMNSLLYDAAPTVSLDALKWIVSNGADPKNVGTKHDLTLLQQVALRPHAERITYFLNFGLNPLERSRDGRTVMHLAAQGGLDRPTLTLLMAKGLKTNDTDNLGRTPLFFASVKSIGILVAAGADINAKDQAGMTALHQAAKEGSQDVVSELLNNSASVFAKDSQGRTPLHYAAMQRNADTVIDTLLAAGAPVTARDNEGRSPKDLALEARENSNNYRTSIDRL